MNENTTSSGIAGLKGLRHGALRALHRISWLAALVARLTLGVVFVQAGWGKVNHLGKVTGFFTTLGIPAPSFVAGLVGYCELICGALILIGLITRIATVPLIVTMIVAIATAKAPEIHDLPSLLALVEFAYGTLLLLLAVNGPGALSIDALVAHAIERTRSGFGPPARRGGRLEERHA